MGSPSASIPSSAPSLGMGLRIKLSVMMFLQFAIWGAWFVTFFPYMQETLHFDPVTTGWIFSTMALGTIFSPMLVGLIADRFFASEKLMAVLHLVGAGLLYVMGNLTSPTQLFIASLAYALVYGPSLALSNSIAFRHVPDATRDFPGLRVLGTFGWIAVNLIVGSVLIFFTPIVDGKHAATYTTDMPFLFAAALSVALAVFSLLLPRTPPTGKADEALPFKKAIVLLKQPSFALFFGVSFVITIAMAFYYSLTPGFLGSVGVEDPNTTMTIGQWSELMLLPLLPWFLFRFGMKGVLMVGMLAWGIRYGIFAMGNPYWLVIASLALHGVCFDFFFAAAFIHVDNEAPSSIRASAQSLFIFLTYGVGMFLGSILSGEVQGTYSASLQLNAVNSTRIEAEQDKDQDKDKIRVVEVRTEPTSGHGSTKQIILKSDHADFDLEVAPGKSVPDYLEATLHRQSDEDGTRTWSLNVTIPEGKPSSHLSDTFTIAKTKGKPIYSVASTNWTKIWTVPSVGILICLAVFVLFFRSRGGPIEKRHALEKASEVLE